MGNETLHLVTPKTQCPGGRRWCYGCDMPYDAAPGAVHHELDYCPSCLSIGARVRALVGKDRGGFLPEPMPSIAAVRARMLTGMRMREDRPPRWKIALVWNGLATFALVWTALVLWTIVRLVAGHG